MAVTQYIGARYVPLFADPAEWSSANAYEALTIVLHEGNSFTSKQPVPVGIAIDNEEYWAQTGNYNAQVEQYRRDTTRAIEIATEVGSVIPQGDFSADNTVKAYIDAQDANIATTIEDLNEELDADVATLSDKALFGRIPTRQYVEATNVGKFEFDTSIYYAQGGCTDGFYIYQMLTTIASAPTQHSMLYKLDQNFNVITSAEFEHSFHGNSLTWDATRNYIYAYRGTGRIVVIDPSSLEIIHETPALTGGYDNISCFAVNENFAIANLTGTNYYLLYRRFGNTFATFGGVEAPNTGVYNFRQDGVIHENVFYQLLSGKSQYNKSMIRAISVGGTVAGDFVITNQNQEFESLFVLNNKFYTMDAIGNVYTIPIGSNAERETGPYYYGLMEPTNINPAVDIFVQYPLANAAEAAKEHDAFRFLECTINNKAQIFQLLFPSWSGLNLQKRNMPFRACGWGAYELGSVNNDNQITTHIVNIDKGQIASLKYIPWSDANYMALYEMRAIKISDGTSKLLRILRAELEDIPTLKTKVENFFNTAIGEGFTIFDAAANSPTQMSGYGVIRARGGNVAGYSCINLNLQS